MFPGLSWGELMLVGVIAILLFGKRLPEVAKTMGAKYRQFRQGLSEFQSQVDLTDLSRPTPSYRSTTSGSSAPSSSSYASSADDYDEPTAPRFEPPPSEPTPPGGDKV